MSKDISGTWEGITKLIKTKNGWNVINTVNEPFGQFRTKMYKANSKGMVVDWNAIVDEKKDLMELLLKRFEVVPQIEEKLPTKKKKKSTNTGGDDGQKE